ncbi:(2Fe-2S)-binding protein [Anaerovibrio sp. RM50]|uniref:(2Fe-2S)-binding protein n=1 Tax=Anaerovibrio sp. RM50 TaxID=1200557 RepID=UPI000483A44A|nr:(2Fe-2S)-binding protein [Anaerovibrio sp. RM50]
MNRNKEACHCKNITYGMIEDAVNAGCTSYEELKEKLRFGTSCGKCQDFIHYLLRDIKESREKSF